jgi:hypothetical protein
MSNSNIGDTATTTPTYTQNDLYKAIHWSTLDTELLEKVLAQPDINPNSTYAQGSHPPLILLVTQNNQNAYSKELQLKKLKILLAHPKIDPNLKFGSETPLTSAVALPNPDVVKLLLEHPKIDVNIIDNADRNAFKRAIAMISSIRRNPYSYTDEYPKNAIELILKNLDMLIFHPKIDKNTLIYAYHRMPELEEKIQSRLSSPRGLAELANKEQLPPQLTGKIYEMITGRQASMEDYDDRQFVFKQKQELDALIKKQNQDKIDRDKMKESRKPTSNKGGRKTRRKSTSARYSRFGKTRSSKRAQ